MPHHRVDLRIREHAAEGLHQRAGTPVAHDPAEVVEGAGAPELRVPEVARRRLQRSGHGAVATTVRAVARYVGDVLAQS